MREIKLSPEDIQAEVAATNEIRNRIPVLTGIHIHYRLRIPSGSRELVDRALERHVSKCPTAVSLSEAVDFTWSADIDER